MMAAGMAGTSRLIVIGHAEPNIERCADLQAYISRARMESFSLTADMMYVASNAPRIARALFEIAARNRWSGAAELLLKLCKVRHAVLGIA